MSKTTFKDIMDIYDSDVTVDTFNALVYGDIGSGKTYLAKTCPGPVLIHSFDPGGSKSINDVIGDDKGIYVERFETEDSKKPTEYARWEKKFDALRNEGFFENVGTFILDSVTTWSESMMNEILKRQGRQGGIAQLMDWQVQMNTIRDTIKRICALPCNCIVIGHIELDKDEVTGKMITNPMITGKMKAKMPLLFDEIYVTLTKETRQGVEYQLLTQSNGLYRARTRLGKGGVFEAFEEPNITKLLNKAGIKQTNKKESK
jgi:hypothetical protein